MVHTAFLRPAWCSEATRTLPAGSTDLLRQAYFDCYFTRFPEWYFRLGMNIPATIWVQARPGHRMTFSAAAEEKLERFQHLLEQYAWALAVVAPASTSTQVHQLLVQALDRAVAGLEQMRIGDIYGALARWQRAASFIAAIEEEVSAFRLRLLVDAESYIDCATPNSWPSQLRQPTTDHEMPITPRKRPPPGA